MLHLIYDSSDVYVARSYNVKMKYHGILFRHSTGLILVTFVIPCVFFKLHHEGYLFSFLVLCLDNCRIFSQNVVLIYPALRE